jgi:hypothetical protein
MSEPMPTLPEILDGTPFVGLAVTNVHTGYNASIEFEDGKWSPHEFGATASEAILKALRLYAPVPAPAPAIPPLPY